MRPAEITILGQRVHTASLVEMVAHVASGIDEGRKQFIVAQNPEKITLCLDDGELSDTLRTSATLVTADGVGVVIAAWLMGYGGISRVTGIDLLYALLDLASVRGMRVFLYGATNAVCQRAGAIVKRRYPGLELVGTHHGFETNNDRVLKCIREAKPDFLFVALGSPRQEKWIGTHLDELPVACAMGIGGSLDIIAGTVHRAPTFLQRRGMEWLFRLIQQPSRLRRVPRLLRFVLRIVAFVVRRSLMPPGSAARAEAHERDL